MAKVALETKKLMAKEIIARLTDAKTLIVTRYKGLSAQDINELRKEIKRIEGGYLVVKDSIARKALADSVNNGIIEFIQGEVGITAYKSDPSIVSKMLVKFSKEHELLKICGGFADGAILSKQDIISIAALPARDVLLTRLAITLNSPIRGIAVSLNGIICKLAYALKAVKDKMEK